MAWCELSGAKRYMPAPGQNLRRFVSFLKDLAVRRFAIVGLSCDTTDFEASGLSSIWLLIAGRVAQPGANGENNIQHSALQLPSWFSRCCLLKLLQSSRE